MIDFSKIQKFGIFFFIALGFIFVGAFVYKKQVYGETFTYSIDFTGGTQVLISFSRPVRSEEVSAALDKDGFPRVTIREFSPTELLVRAQNFDSDVTGTAERIREALEKALAGVTIDIRQVDSVGAGVGASLWWNFLKGGIVGLAIMLLYILARFWSIGFALGAVGSLFHDALLILTFCLLFNYEISVSVIFAVLTVLGYSINDTIIIFARIRENIARLGKTKSLADIVNISINETLRRTLLTTLSTIIVLVPLIAVGGELLRTLAIMLMIGFIFGTYSSICVASPIMLFFTKNEANAKAKTVAVR